MAAPPESTDPEHRYFDMDTANAGAPLAPEPGEAVEAVDPDVELRGIRRVKLASLLGVLGIALTLIVPIALLFASGVGFDFASVNGSQAVSLWAWFEAAIALLTIGPILLVVAFAVYLAGFAELRKADPRFTVPLALGVIGLIGLLMIAAAFGLLLDVVLQIANCGGAGNVTPGCVDTSPVDSFPLLVLGGILPALIGWIGLVIGIYRTGSRYSSSMTKIGGILYIVPMVNVIAPLLVWLGARDIEKVLEQPMPAPEPMMGPA